MINEDNWYIWLILIFLGIAIISLIIDLNRVEKVEIISGYDQCRSYNYFPFTLSKDFLCGSLDEFGDSIAGSGEILRVDFKENKIVMRKKY